MSSQLAILFLSLIGLVLLGTAQTSKAGFQTNSNAANLSRASTTANTSANAPPKLRRTTAAVAPRNGVKSLACRYLTDLDAGQIFGKPMIYYASTTYGKRLTCMYTPPNEFPFAVDFIAETCRSAATADAIFAKRIERAWGTRAKIRIENPAPKRTYGIGDEAYFGTANDNYEYTYIYFRKGKTIFEISALGKSGSNFNADDLKSVAKKIADNFDSGQL